MEGRAARYFQDTAGLLSRDGRWPQSAMMVGDAVARSLGGAEAMRFRQQFKGTGEGETPFRKRNRKVPLWGWLLIIATTC